MNGVFDFLDEVKRVCAANQIEVRLQPTEAVHVLETAEGCAGYFDSKLRVLVVAVKSPAWLEVTAHEFGHAQQYIDEQYLDKTAWEVWERWMDGAEFPKVVVDGALETVLKCELDAERRAVGLMSRYGLCNDIPAYIASANGDLLRYRFARKHRRFPEVRDVDWSSVTSSEFVPLDKLKLTRKVETFIKAASV